MWELLITPNAQAPTIKGEFSLMYKFDGLDETKHYKYFFDITDYQVNLKKSSKIKNTAFLRLCIYWKQVLSQPKVVNFVVMAPSVISI